MAGGYMMLDGELAAQTVRQMRFPPQSPQQDGAEGAISNPAVDIEQFANVRYSHKEIIDGFYRDHRLDISIAQLVVSLNPPSLLLRVCLVVRGVA